MVNDSRIWDGLFTGHGRTRVTNVVIVIRSVFDCISLGGYRDATYRVYVFESFRKSGGSFN